MSNKHNARENILRKIQQALAKPVPVPFAATAENKASLTTLFQPSQKEMAIEFAENFTQLQGKFSYCTSEAEATKQIAALIETKQWQNIFCREPELKYLLSINGFKNFEYPNVNSCHAAITTCEFLVARTGSLILSSAQKSGRTTSVYTPIHICIAYANQLVYDIADGLTKMQEKYGKNQPSLISLATGPSRTADIEKTLVVGVHGPKEVFVFLIDQ